MTTEEMYKATTEAYRRVRKKNDETVITYDDRGVYLSGGCCLHKYGNEWVAEGVSWDLFKRIVRYIKKTYKVWIDDEIFKL